MNWASTLVFDRLARETPLLFVAARAEAGNLNHQHTGTGHILLALVREDESPVTREISVLPAAAVLREAGVVGDAAERAVREAEESTSEVARARTTVGRPIDIASSAGEGELFDRPFTHELEKALGTAARRWPWVTPTHLLLAIVEQGPTAASDVLSTLGVSRTTVRDKLRKLLDDDER